MSVTERHSVSIAVIFLLLLLAVWAAARVLEIVLRTLRLDAWDVLLYLGLAEHDLPKRSRARLL